jgi:ferric-dicitrate binding protein FerR (iron transport regulator)
VANKQILEELLNDDSFVRWLRNKSSEGEQEYWQKWLLQDPTRKALVEQARELIKIVEHDIPIVSESGKELKRLMDTLDQKETRWEERAQYHQRDQYKSRAIWGSVAAGVLLLITVLGFGVNGNYEAPSSEEPSITQEKQEFRTKYGEKVSLSLSDGSKIILNANSKLKYSSTVQEGQDMEVWLEGEAYFDIVHYEGDKQRLFTVNTPDGKVKVLGTKFAVKTTAENTQAVLEKGKIRVNVNSSDAIKGEEAETILRPGELAQFSSTKGMLKRSEINARVYTSWIGDTWFFEKTPLRQVADRIEDTFGVEVKIQKDLQEKILSGSIKSTSLEFLQQALSSVINKPVREKGNTILIGEQ